MDFQEESKNVVSVLSTIISLCSSYLKEENQPYDSSVFATKKEWLENTLSLIEYRVEECREIINTKK